MAFNREQLKAWAREHGIGADGEPLAESAVSRPQLSDDALYGLAGRVVSKLTPQTEADPAGLLAELLCRFGCFIGRTAHVVLDGSVHCGNLFVVKVGETSRSRKGTAAARVEGVLGADGSAARFWQAQQTVFGLSSGEGLIAAIDKKSAEHGDKRVLVRLGEFAEVLAVLKRDGNTLSSVLRNAWDGKVLEIVTRHEAVRVEGAHVSLSADITLAELQLMFETAERFNGTSNRILWLHVARSKLLPFGGEDVDLRQEVRDLNAAADFARAQRRVHFADHAARKMWRSAYERLSRTASADDSSAGYEAAVSRAEAQVMRIALLHALLNQSDHIASEHLRAGLALWEYADESARLIFGGLSKAQRAILEFCATEAKSKTDLYRDLFNGHRPAAVIAADLAELLRQCKLRSVEGGFISAK